MEELIRKSFQFSNLVKIAVGDWSIPLSDDELERRGYLLLHSKVGKSEKIVTHLVSLFESSTDLIVASNNPIFVEVIKSFKKEESIHVISKRQGTYFLSSPTIIMDMTLRSLDPTYLATTADFLDKVDEFIKANPRSIKNMDGFCNQWKAKHNEDFGIMAKSVGVKGKVSQIMKQRATALGF